MSQVKARVEQHADPTLLPRFPVTPLSQLYKQSNGPELECRGLDLHAGISYGPGGYM